MKRLLTTLLVITLFCGICVSQNKTLVSWVHIRGHETVGGSLLTLQADSMYQGIHYTGSKDSTWYVAGSNHRPAHTGQKSSGKTGKIKTTFPGKMAQIAAVYRDGRVRLYRNGKLYAERAARDVDLLEKENNYAVFGLDHFGGENYVSAGIEDARIYDEALTPRQLKALRPNKPSEIEPYAWWDFEGDTLYERTGRYVHHNIGLNNPGEGGSVMLKNGKLMLDRYGFLISTRSYQPETPQWPEDPPDHWMSYHLAHPGPGIAEPGDPNGAFYYNGRYHLHYIYNNPTGFCYAHVSSKDMVHWKWHPTVLAPPKTGHHMFSGTGFFRRDSTPVIIYHGAGSGQNHLVFGRDEYLDQWTDPYTIEPVNASGEKPDFQDYWDPDSYYRKDMYYAISGGEEPKLMKSDSLKNWLYQGRFLHEDYPDSLGVARDEDISCANTFKIGDKWMLLCISHRLGCRYYLGDFEDEKYLPDHHAKMNWRNTNWEDGHQGDLIYFAPESMLTKDGRRVMWAWLIGDVFPSGVQSLPRELTLTDDDRLMMKPLRELKKLRYNEMSWEDLEVQRGRDYHLEKITGDALELKVTFEAPLPEKFGISMLGDQKARENMQLVFGSSRDSFRMGSIAPPFDLKEDEDLILRIFIDKNLVEVFANGRQAAAYASHEKVRKDPNIRLFTRDKDLKIKSIKAWKMKSIYKGNTVFQAPK